MEQSIERVIDGLLFLLANSFTMIWQYFSLLPPVIQIILIVGAAFILFYKRGWNDAMLHLRDEGSKRLEDEYERRRR
jgi:hypothetical protein